MAELWRGSIDAVREHLTGAEVMERWQDHLIHDLESAVEASLGAYFKNLQKTMTMIQGYGIAAVRETDAQRLEWLLNDCLACATWHGWDLPIARSEDVEGVDEPATGWWAEQPVGHDQGPQVLLLRPDRIIIDRQRSIDFVPEDWQRAHPNH